LPSDKEISSSRQRPPVLAVRAPNALGELMMLLPALRLLHDSGLPFDLLIRPFARQLLGTLPYRLVTVASRGEEARRYRRSDAGYALTFRTSIRTLIQIRRGGMRAIGYRSPLKNPLLYGGIKHPVGTHRVIEFFRLARFAVDRICPQAAARGPHEPGHLDLPLSPDHHQVARAALARAGITDAFTVVSPLSNPLHPAGWKVWPQFGELVRQLTAEGRTVLVCPGPGEVESCRRSVAAATLLEGVDLVTLTAILADASAVIANDTGPMHIAAAVGAPTVGIYGQTPPRRYRPWAARAEAVGEKGAWPSVDEVRAAVDRVESMTGAA